MTLRYWAAVALVLGACGTLTLSGALAAPGYADPVPSPSPVSVSVTIPGTPSPSPSSTGTSGSGTSGSSSSGSGSSGSSGSGSTAQLPTEAFGAPTPPAEASSSAGGLTLDHESISNGEWLVATGTGFAAGENVQFVFYPGAIVIGSIPADQAGTAIARFAIPGDMRPGVHIVEATGWSSKRILNKEFTVVSAAGATLPFLWWVLVVLGVLLVGLTVMSWYFRASIARWFGTTAVATESGS